MAGLAGCAAAGNQIESMFPPTGAPPKPEQEAPYPTVGAPPVERGNKPLSADERARLESELTTLLQQRQRMSGVPVSKPDAKPAKKSGGKPPARTSAPVKPVDER